MKTRQEILEDLREQLDLDKSVTKRSFIKSIMFKRVFIKESFMVNSYRFEYLDDYSFGYYFSEESLLTKIATHV